jgi:hypothetical protein
MKNIDRLSAFLAVMAIGLGILLLAFNFIEGLDLRRAWPLLFFIFAAAFYMPALLWRNERHGLGGLYIPGSILAALGLVFTYNTLTGDWGSWLFAWTCIPGGVGLGLMMGARVGGWSDVVSSVGAWMLGVNAAIFAALATFFGTPALSIAGSAIFIVGGFTVVLATLLKPKQVL